MGDPRSRRTLLALSLRWLGRSRGEAIRSVIIAALVTAVVVLALEVRQLSRSPSPAEWNVYSAEANAHLYADPRAARPAPNLVVAHAGGECDGESYTNSIDALQVNYDRGYRLFEMDLAWTADEELVAIHDWNGYCGPHQGSRPTREEFLNQPSTPFTPTSLLMVYEWLETHPDAFIITDVKKRSLEAFAKIRMERPTLVPRFIPQIYLFKDYDLAASLGYRNIILTLYRCLDSTADETIVEFARTHRLFAVTMPQDRCRKSELAARLARLNITVYVHTINDLPAFDELLARGAYGVYTDRLLPRDVALRAARQGASPTQR